MKIVLENVITRNEDIAFGVMDGEIVMMNVEVGNYYNLGRTGSDIWNMLENPVTVEALLQELLEKYRVSREQCENEVVGFLNQLYKEGLIKVK